MYIFINQYEYHIIKCIYITYLYVMIVNNKNAILIKLYELFTYKVNIKKIIKTFLVTKTFIIEKI